MDVETEKCVPCIAGVVQVVRDGGGGVEKEKDGR